ncbi:metalloprotease PmbA [Candidatus Blochmannia ocreatus (nom. nud.)]|uniref:Metalloprotease PmbA n=1 Tax=Candidatus Blochmannia ocreatus (nom. nud.) TaxID=251538 RepID=A0ABY4SVB3_9ENTR|nr:metalloprotease PmbA [Candidatus Blochmannia ocreatus]URJ25359.1 metalloprotease PmbA [Candidatus Blochmannia ocreatus]
MHHTHDITQQCNSLKETVNHALNIAHKYSNTAEISITKTIGITISTRYGNLENVEFNNNTILKVTVFCGQKKGSAFSSNLHEKTLTYTIKHAIDIATYTSLDPYSGIADKELLSFNAMHLDLCHPINLDTKLGANLAAISEQTALKYDKRIIYTEGGKFSSSLTIKAFGNSHGMLQSYTSTQHYLCCSIIAESNGIMEQNYAYTLSRSLNDLRSPEWVGTECAKRTLAQLHSKKLKTMESPILFSADMATSLFQHLATAIHGDNVYRKTTFLLNSLKTQIFPNWISIEEYPHILKGWGSAPFDNEGVQTKNRTIIKHGILNTWLLNSYSARKIGLKSTGHANNIYNWHISYKNYNFSELVKLMNRGLIVTNIMGQGVNIITGDYSKGVSGFWVENGNIQYPVHEITIAGNLRKMFYNIDSIGCDIETRGNIICGSVLISSMMIAGI